MVTPRARYISELLDVHFEDLGFVWSQRRSALTSPDHTQREFAELTERLEAHAQGLLCAPSEALLTLLGPRLGEGDADDNFAAAYALLRTGDVSATQAVLIAFSRSQGPALAGLRDALSLAPMALFESEMRSALEHAKPLTAVSAAVVLANHRRLDAHSARLGQLLQDEDSKVCELAWRTLPIADGLVAQAVPRRPFNHALVHVAPAVRTAAWAAAAWTGQARAMPLLRQMANAGDQVALHWLAVLGGADDATPLQSVALALDDVAQGCELLARHGHPLALDALVNRMEDQQIPARVAAREAFSRITGADIRGARTALPVPEDADDFTRDMAPEVWLPDVEKARALLKRRGAEWSAATRWRTGMRLDGPIDRDVLTALDLEARWDVAARSALSGRRTSAPPPIH